jgi:hypothetical protein
MNSDETSRDTAQPATVPPLTLTQLQSGYQEALQSSDMRVMRVMLEILWQRLQEALREARP